MLYALEKWIAMPTVSGVPSQLEECRRGAKFLKAVFQQLGAEARLIPGAPGHNPLVYGQFSARSTKTEEQGRPLNVLFYGHYDVIAADIKKWDHPPFKLTGRVLILKCPALDRHCSYCDSSLRCFGAS